MSTILILVMFSVLEKLVDLRVDFSMTSIVLSMVIISMPKQIIQLKLLTVFKQSTTIN